MMEIAAGVIAVDRLGWLKLGVHPLTPTVGGTARGAFSRYRGFDGLVWPGIEESMEEFSFPSVDGLARLDDWDVVVKSMKAVATSQLDVVALAQEEVVEEMLTKGWSLLGWDVGYYNAEYSHFSILLNDVVFALDREMGALSTVLNNHLLLERASDSRMVTHARLKAITRGARLEICDQIECLAILTRKEDVR